MTQLPETGTLSPDDLTLQEVDSILDPGATGVAELSPANTRQKVVVDLGEAAARAEGEERLILQARQAQAMAIAIDKAGITLARSVIDEARASRMLVPEAEAMAAIATTQPAFQEVDPDDHDDYQTRCIELAAHVGLPVVQAQVHLARAWIRTLSDVEPRLSLDLARKARILVSDVHPRTSGVHECLSNSASILGSVAWASEHNYELARRFLAISMLHAREMDFGMLAGHTHLLLGNVLTEMGDLTGARRHLQRSNLIYQHHHAWFRASRAMYWLGRTQIRFSDLAGARRTLARMESLSEEHSETRQVMLYGHRFLAGLVDAYDGDPAEAIARIEPIVGHNMISDDSRTQCLIALAHCHERLDRYDRAAELYRQAYELSERIHSSRIDATTSGVVLSDEIAELKSVHGALSVDAARNQALLEAILPPSAYREFSQTGEAEARFHENVAIFYSDFADFTGIASGMPPQQLVEILGELFDGFDRIMTQFGCERVETIGDAYLAVAGMGDIEYPSGSGTGGGAGLGGGEPVEVSMVRAALEVRRFLAGKNAEFEALGSPRFEARIGVHAGSIVAGLVGTDRVRFAIFGDAVNTAQRLEAGGVAGEVTVSERVADAVAGADAIAVEQRESIAAKGKGELAAFHASVSS